MLSTSHGATWHQQSNRWLVMRGASISLGGIILILLCASSLAKVARFGGFSLFYPKQWFQPAQQAFQQGLSRKINYLKEFVGEKEQILQLYEDDTPDSNLLKHILQNERVEKYRRLSYSEPLLQFSLSTWPIGWKSYLFRVKVLTGSSEGDIGELELVSIDGGEFKRKSKRLRIVTKYFKSDQGLSLQPFVWYSNMDRKDVKQLVDELLHFLRPMTRDALLMFRARKSQHKEYRKVSDVARKEKRAKELDRIIHPEKYKPKVIHRSAGSGTGRYSPSEATKARRQVIRKGG